MEGAAMRISNVLDGARNQLINYGESNAFSASVNAHNCYVGDAERMAMRIDMITDRAACGLAAKDREVDAARDKMFAAAALARTNYIYLAVLIAVLLVLLYFALTRVPTPV
jgi:hypothetical protein